MLSCKDKFIFINFAPFCTHFLFLYLILVQIECFLENIKNYLLSSKLLNKLNLYSKEILSKFFVFFHPSSLWESVDISLTFLFFKVSIIVSIISFSFSFIKLKLKLLLLRILVIFPLVVSICYHLINEQFQLLVLIIKNNNMVLL